MLVVIAVITILLALLLPTLKSAKDMARRTACLNNLKQLDAAVHMYADDNNGTLPLAKTNANWPPLGAAPLRLVRPYVGLKGAPSPDDGLMACPADRFYYDGDDYHSQPEHTVAKYSYLSYSFNSGNAVNHNPGWPGVAGTKLANIKEPTKTLLVIEFAAFLPYSWHRPGSAARFNNSQDMVSFADGHVKFIKMYWDATGKTAGRGVESWQYEPPAEYEYRWSGQ